MNTSLVFEFGTVEVHDHYVIAIMNEGVIVKPEYNEVLIDIAKRYFEGIPFGYITNRKNSYSVDPRIYIETSKIENLKAFAVVADDIKHLSSVEVEKIFLKKPFQQFKILNEAISWVLENIDETKDL